MSKINKIHPVEKIRTLHPFIEYRNKELFIEGISYLEIIQEYHTPVFIFSKNRIKDNIKNFSKTFKKANKNIKFLYPYRANYIPNILSIINSEGWGAEVTSSFEYKIAKSIKSSEIVLNGFNRKYYSQFIRDKELFYISIDSIDDVKHLNEIGSKLNKIINVGIRVHPELKSFQRNALVQPGFKLGYDIKSGDAERIVSSLLKMKWINIIALNTHVANRQIRPDLHSEALRSLIKFADKLYSNHKIDIEYINIGGGFESRNLLEQNSSLDEFVNNFSDELSNAKKEYTLILEPGRYTICDTAIVLTEVLIKKINKDCVWIIVDVGINTLIPLKSASFDVIPTILDAHYDIQNVGDCIATSMGIIKEKIPLPNKIKIGDFLGIINVGAYTLSMSEQFVLLKPTVIMIDGNTIKTIKRAENEEEYIKKIKSAMW